MLWARVRARHQFYGKCGDSRRGDLLERLYRAKRAQEADQRLSRFVQRHVIFAVDVIGTIAQHLQNGIGTAEHGGAVGNNLCALVHIGRIGIAGLFARAQSL